MGPDTDSSAAAESQLADLQTRLRVLEDERAIMDTLYKYGHFIDYGRHPEWVDCFTPDGAFDIRFRGEPQRRFEGHEELAAFVANHTFPPARYHKHFVLDPQFEIEGDAASVVSYLTRFDAIPSDQPGSGMEPVIKAFGRYIDTMRRCSDGRWRFVERIGDSDAFVDLGQTKSWTLA
jgi:hypothetical protein